MDEKKEDILIASLRLIKNSDDGLSYNNLVTRLNEMGYGLDTNPNNNRNSALNVLIASLTFGGGYNKVDGSTIPPHIHRFLNKQGYRQLLDYDELKLAREANLIAQYNTEVAIKNSEESTSYAKKALYVAIATGVCSIGLMVFDMINS